MAYVNKVHALVFTNQSSGTELPNRIAMMPMGVFSPRLLDPKTGAYTKDGADYYIERAKGGTGLIVTGVVPIIPMPGKILLIFQMNT